MKIYKNIFNVILIFAIIQLFGMIYINNNVYAHTDDDSIISRTFKEGSDYDKRKSEADNIIAEATNSGLTDSIDEVREFAKAVGAVIFFVIIGGTFIGLNLDRGVDKARAKQILVVTIVLAVLFLFGDKIIDIFKGFWEQSISLF